MTFITFQIANMRCTACAAKLDQKLNKVHGIIAASADYPSSSINITYDEHKTNLDNIASEIVKTGFKIPVLKIDITFDFENIKNSNTFIKKLECISGVRQVSVSSENTLSILLWPVNNNVENEIRSICKEYNLNATINTTADNNVNKELSNPAVLQNRLIISLILTALYIWNLSVSAKIIIALIIIFISGREFFINSIRGLSHGIIGRDLLVSLTLLLLFSISVYGSLYSENISFSYFYLIGILISIILLEKYIEIILNNKSETIVKKLIHLQPKTAFIDFNGNRSEFLIDKVQKGDTVIIRSGERVPVDGIITNGTSVFDSSLLSDIEILEKKSIGDNVYSGSMNRKDIVEIDVSSSYKLSYLSKLIEVANTAISKKSSFQKKIDVIAAYYSTFIIFLSILTFLIWSFLIYPGNYLLSTSIAVKILITICPCVFGLSTALCINNSLAYALTKNILFSSPEFLLNSSAKDHCIIVDGLESSTSRNNIKSRLATIGLDPTSIGSTDINILFAGRDYIDNIFEISRRTTRSIKTNLIIYSLTIMTGIVLSLINAVPIFICPLITFVGTITVLLLSTKKL